MKYYIQDSRGYVGNCMLWWRKGNNGYTTDIDKAGKYSKDEAIKICKNRNTDKMWPVNYINKKIMRCVDMQYCNKDEI